MVRYVIEKLKSQEPLSDTAEAAFAILELPGRKQVGTLRRNANMFTAESKKHRNTSEAADGMLVLKMAFRSDNFFIEKDHTLAPLKQDDLQ